MSIRLGERAHRARFEAATQDPERSQAQVLARLLAHNADTAFGREHGFGAIRTPAEYARRVPVRDYEAFRPYVERIASGVPRVLTADPVVMFTTTSGTTSEPKRIPVTAAWRSQMASLTRLWMLGALRDHPRCFGGKVLYAASPAVEGMTPGGLPFGSLSGVIFRRVPWVVRRQYVLPYAVSVVADPDVRYFLTMRLALGQQVSIASTPNPTSFLRLAETAAERSDAIVRAIYDGALGTGPFETTPGCGYTPAEAAREIQAAVRPDPLRARQLAEIADGHGALLPRLCWPGLALVGCWLGGSAGIHARRLEEAYGAVPLRDLGLLASEGRMTIPLDDGSPAGALAVHSSFYEFVPEDRIEDPAPPVRLAHELEDGRRYYVLLTGGNGLYRYDINDVVEVQGFHGRTPRLGFVRKGRDMVSITGEKLHLNQIQAAVREAERAIGLDVWQFRIIPDAEDLRYDLLIEARPAPLDGEGPRFAAAFDRTLAAANVEYASKRRSRRLRQPRLFLMRPGWADRMSRADFRRGKREAQYKWPAIRQEWDEASRGEVVRRFEPGE
jgi:hypothetical protein